MQHKLCANCGFLNPSFKFCGECGMPLDGTSRSAERPAADTVSIEQALPHGAERRQLTILFCDIVDSTAFTEKLDPEELRNLLEVYRTCIMEVVLAQNGHIARYFGDGILVYFGYPIAHEDTAHRAVRAALGIVAAIETLNPYLHKTFGVEINVRISIDTGRVVVWHISGQEAPEAIDIVGKMPNVAARMEKLATPNTVVIGDTTHQLVEGFFKCEALGASVLRGISQPVNIYQVSGEIPAQSRLDIASESGLTPLIGREREVELLKQGWTQALATNGQALLIQGEAGIGKSRCVQLIQEHVESHSDAVTLEGRCSPYYQNSPLYPILSLFQEHVVQFTNTDTARRRLEKLENLLRDYNVSTVGQDAEAHTPETLPLLAELLDIPFEIQRRTETGTGAGLYGKPVKQDTYPSEWRRRQRRQQTLEVLVQVLLKMSERQPILFVVEDLHWIDPSSIEFLTLLIERIENARIFTILSWRSDTDPSIVYKNRHNVQSNEDGNSQLVPDGNFTNSAIDREILEKLLRPAWAKTLQLEALTPPEVETMIQHVAGDTQLPPNLLTKIVEMTEGVPLFVEELTQMMLSEAPHPDDPDRATSEEGDALTLPFNALDATSSQPQTMQVPVTLQDLLTARLDELGTAKEIIQLGATLGREWTAELFHKIAAGVDLGNNIFTDFSALKDELDKLVNAFILNRNETTDNQFRYTFRHPLLRETAYQSLLKSRRQRYHQQIAEVLEGADGSQPELVAYHYTEAGLPEKAVDYWHRAAHRALERSANVEGVRHIMQGLAALETLSTHINTSERREAAERRELELQTTLGTALIATKGYASPEVEVAYTRARELLETLEKSAEACHENAHDRMTSADGSEVLMDRIKALRFPVLFGLWLSHLVRGRLRSARELGEACVAIAKQAENQAFEVEAHRALGATLYYLSEFNSALAHLEAGIERYQPQHHPVPAFLHYVAEPGMTLLAYSSPLLWCIGYPSQAEERIHQAVNIGKDTNHPFSEAVSLHFKTVLYQYRGEPEKVNTSATQMLQICQEHGFSAWEAAATVLKGWAFAAQNCPEEGIAIIREGINAWKETRGELLMPLFLALLGQAHQRAGQYNLALQTLDTASRVITRTGERTYAAELARQKGALCLMLAEATETGGNENTHSTVAQAESYFQEALAIARQQNAKSWELRAALSLSELWRTQNRGEDAYNLLQPIYAWFSEGLDTDDLVRAKNLLEKLRVTSDP
ncbi:AAA family ATPase [Candidatus Poribacteria bacterium]|nr:AAA family ATPase [Candidatus Poribacteria bacterium]MYG05930.1 AAA family ATPase [Candidatus Poribacteria bacterium]MYK22634.1 AAA family ATPase [Candidatus Poribacteria bacterium]